MNLCLRLGFAICLLVSLSIAAQTSTNSSATNQTATAVRAEQIRTACVEGRRYVCGRVLQIVPDGLVVESGYADLLKPPLNKSWVVPGTATLNRAPNTLEEKRPDAICIGLVFLTAIPKSPKVHEYDYVVLHAYPAGEHKYKPVPGVEKTIRRFSASLERAISLNLETEAAKAEKSE